MKKIPAFSERFYELRDEAGMNQKEFADHIGIARPTVGFYENGDRIPDALILNRICRKTGCSADYLLGLTDVKTLEIEIQAASKRYGLSEAALSVMESLDQKQAKILDTLLLSPRLPELLSALLSCRNSLVSVRNEEVMERIEQTDRTEEEWLEIMGRVTFLSESDRHLLSHIIVHHDALMERTKLSGKAAADAAVSSLRRIAGELGNDLVEEGRRQAEGMDEAELSQEFYEKMNRIEEAGIIKRRQSKKKEVSPNGNDNQT